MSSLNKDKIKEDALNNLKGLLGHIASFDEKTMDDIVRCFKPKKAKKNDFLLSEGEVCKSFIMFIKVVSGPISWTKTGMKNQAHHT